MRNRAFVEDEEGEFHVAALQYLSGYYWDGPHGTIARSGEARGEGTAGFVTVGGDDPMNALKQAQEFGTMAATPGSFSRADYAFGKTMEAEVTNTLKTAKTALVRRRARE
jgi:hypothetical protein